MKAKAAKYTWAWCTSSTATHPPFVPRHPKPPKSLNLGTNAPTTGDFRDSAPGRVALAQVDAAVTELGASHAIFLSPPLFAASAANRKQMATFFGEIATEEAVGAPRVWVPDGLWDLRTAITFAKEIGVLCAFDPLVRDPGQPPEVHYDLDVDALYWRIAGLGRTGPIRSERIDDLVMLLEHYEGMPATIAFDSPSRWNDARNLKKALEDGVDE